LILNFFYREPHHPSKKYLPLCVRVVVCEENWKEVDKDTGEIITKTSRHAWISGKPLEPACGNQWYESTKGPGMLMSKPYTVLEPKKRIIDKNIL